MKKILMGLVALSSISLAAFNLGNPQKDTNVFEFGGKDSLTVKLTLIP